MELRPAQTTAVEHMLPGNSLTTGHIVVDTKAPWGWY